MAKKTVKHLDVSPHVDKWVHLRDNPHCSLQVNPRGTHFWATPEGLFHRVDENGHQDGPAVIHTNGTLKWFINGNLHRLDGPAIIWHDGELWWCLDDKGMTREQWAQDIRVVEFNTRTQEGAEQWLTRL